MKRLLFAFLFVCATAVAAQAMGLRQGFGKYRYGESCQTLFSGPSFALERARPIWNKQLQMFGLAYDPDVVAKSPFILHYDKEEKTQFQGIPLNRIYYGCDKNTGRFSLVVLVHDLLTVKDLVKKTTALLGEPTDTTMIQTIWVLPDLYVQIDQVYMLIYDRRAGKV
ncbi:hypothetical protein [Solidesulfovibrio sp. C21]|uniref:hypothetical protein n=1 Tax=Solidesulfovibrio sp. C21 TaxID=3398613 RepID=UPI0039FBA953